MMRKEQGHIVNMQLKKILLIDDDKYFVTVLQQHLRLSGFMTEEISTINEAKYFVSPFVPDLVLCSTSMMQHLSIILATIHIPPGLEAPKIIILSNQGSREDILNALKINADDCISKNVSLEMIVMTIKATLNI